MYSLKMYLETMKIAHLVFTTSFPYLSICRQLWPSASLRIQKRVDSKIPPSVLCCLVIQYGQQIKKKDAAGWLHMLVFTLPGWYLS